MAVHNVRIALLQKLVLETPHIHHARKKHVQKTASLVTGQHGVHALNLAGPESRPKGEVSPKRRCTVAPNVLAASRKRKYVIPTTALLIVSGLIGMSGELAA
jgi:hypothetical protein